MYYVPQPTETARLIQTLLAKDHTQNEAPHRKIREKEQNEKAPPVAI